MKRLVRVVACSLTFIPNHWQQTLMRCARAAMQPHIKKLAKACHIPEPAFRCKRGAAEKVVASLTEVCAQLVVVGTVRRKGTRARLLGNTAEKVLLHFKTDVLAIKL